MLEAPGNEAGTPPPGATYVDMYNDFNCSDCHTDKWEGWIQTKHAVAWPDLMAGFEQDYCEPCHATGAGVPSIYPATGYVPATNSPTYLQNVTCQTCHGPASAHQSASFAEKPSVIGLVTNASLCGSCHYATAGLSSTHHPTYNEWEVAGHNTSQRLPSYVKQAQCSNCHEAWNAMEFIETGGVYKTVLRESDEDAPLTWDITCSTCHDPHSMGAGGSQLRQPADQICAICHNAGGALPGTPPHHPMAEMRNNTAGYGIDRTGLEYMPDVICADCHMGTNLAGLPNHTFRPNPATCVVCHDTTFSTNESAQAYIDMIASLTAVGVAGTEPVVDDASAMIEEMRGNRTSLDLVVLQGEYEIAIFNLESVVSDSSEGNHNPRLASALLNDSRTRAENILTVLTPPDKITGIRAFRADNGSIIVEWNASNAADFAQYRVYVLTLMKSNVTSDMWTTAITNVSTTYYEVIGVSNDTVAYVYVTAVDTNGNEITNALVATTVVGNFEDVIAGLQQQVAAFQDLVASLQDNITALEDQIGGLEDDKAQLNQDIANLEDKVSQAQDQRTMWAVLGIAVGAIIGLLIGLVLGRMKPGGAKPTELPPQEKS